MQPRKTIARMVPNSDAMTVSPTTPAEGAEAPMDSSLVSIPVLGTLMSLSSSVGMRLFKIGMMLSGM